MLRLSGQVKGQWVAELSRACEAAGAADRELVLDLAEVSFIDPEGVALFHHLHERHVRIRNCSLFAAEQLREVVHVER